MTGSVYVLTNPSMPGLLKIGRTSGSPAARGKQLFTTGVPAPFQVVGECRCEDPAKVEKTIHDIFDGQRHHQKREFFQVQPSQVAAALRLMGEVIGFNGQGVAPTKAPRQRRLNIKTPDSVWKVLPEGECQLWGVDIMRVAIEAGADPNEELYGNFPLTVAIYNQQHEHVRALLECGACVDNVFDDSGLWARGETQTPLVAAIKMGECDLVVELIDRGADVNLRSSSEGLPLSVAQEWGWDDIIEVLARSGASTEVASD